MGWARSSSSRSAIVCVARNLISRTLITPTPPPKSLLHVSPSVLPRTAASRRFVAALVTVETMIPLHSAIASARLRSSIGVDSTCWSSLSQDFALPR